MAKTERKSEHSHAQKVAAWLDNRFKIPGTDIRFGLDPVIGLIPGAGDWISGMISTYFIVLGIQADVAPAVLFRMGFNVLLDTAIGSIPLLGDLFDVGWKSNTKNARLLEKYCADSSQTEKHSRWLLWLIGIVLVALIIALLVLIAELFQAIF